MSIRSRTRARLRERTEEGKAARRIRDAKRRRAKGMLTLAESIARQKQNAKPKAGPKPKRYLPTELDGTAKSWKCGKHTITVDDADYDWLKGRGWSVTKAGYVRRQTTKEERMAGMANASLMHHEVLGRPIKPYVTDHVNGVRTDNRRCNLRIATPTQNCQNKQGPPRNNKTGILGVFQPADKCGQYRARIVVNKRKLHLGYFDSLDKAAKARRDAEIKYFGEFAPSESANAHA